MFETLFKPKFYIKCKKALKVTRTRIERIKKKRDVIERYMKSDIVEFLKGGFDIRAYDKAEALLLEQNRSTCYGQIDDFCRRIADSLSVMQKQKECPEECVEAVQSLMHAAARFADLPELRDLRSLFVEKYRDTLQHGVNEEFSEKLKARPPAKELKLQLMHDIALEASIDWDSKALEQKLFVPPMPIEEKSYEFKSTKHNNKPLWAIGDHSTAEKESQDAVNKFRDTGEYVTIRGSEKDDKSHEIRDATIRVDKDVVGGKDETRCNDKFNSKRGLSYSNIPPPYVKKPGEHQSTSNKSAVSDLGIINGKNCEDDSTPGRAKLSMGPDDTGWPRSRRTRKELPTVRATSLSPQYTYRTEAPEMKTRHNRTASLEPVMLARHVHPKLPDYDELASWFAARKGR